VCRRRNDGAAQAASAISVMRRAGVPAPMVWVDVEYRHVHPWTHDHGANVQVLEGVLRGLSDAHLPYGVYTTPTMWRNITGGWSLKVPNWLPGGGSDAASARSACRTSGTGGRTWLGQYTREFDEDLTCPVMDATPGHPGPLWPYRNTTLSLGSTGAAVRALQGALKVNVTGTYDVATTSAVVQFQLAHSLPVNGRVDTDDWRALGAFRWIGAHGFWLSWVARLA
jgi:hypothetical protein